MSGIDRLGGGTSVRARTWLRGSGGDFWQGLSGRIVLTFLLAACASTLPEHTIDGRNIWPLMAAEPGAKSPREASFFYWGNQLHAVRSGRWKLHFAHEYRSLNGRAGGRDGNPEKCSTMQIGLALFDLESDVSETANVAEQHPEVVSRLTEYANSIRHELGDGRLQGNGVRPAGRIVNAPTR